jgi:hypothetical protein
MKALDSISLYFLSVAALILQACTTQSSSTGNDGDPVPTGSMNLEARIDASDASVAIVSIQVNDGHAVQYRLDGGDYFKACVSGQCKNLIDDRSQLGAYIPFFEIGYANRFDFWSDTDYVLSFNRPDAKSAPNSRVSLPASFTIDTPANQQLVTDGEVVQVAWSPSGARDAVTVYSTAHCRHYDGRTTRTDKFTQADVNADGRENVRIDDLIAQARAAQVSISAIQNCDVDVEVTHERYGIIDPAFRGGYILGVVSRKVRLNYLPSR